MIRQNQQLTNDNPSKMSTIQAMEKVIEYIQYLEEQIAILDENEKDDFKD